VAIVSLERLYPLPVDELIRVLGRFPNASADLIWVQDEPANQGAWSYLALNLPQRLAESDPGRGWTLRPITRRASSAPSVGSAKVHEAQQRELVESAFRDR
jgi:2-oxoglutarate dehydrogenase complex dehydrogenase (E1) component-like enzyme